jgi:DNA mismatch repair protein MSH6
MFGLLTLYGIVLIAGGQAFKKLSVGLAELGDSSESFESKTIHGLLRSAPDLLPNIKHVERMYKKPAGEKGATKATGHLDTLESPFSLIDVELEPQEGNDEAYDEIMNEINDLEATLERELKTFQKKLGYVSVICSFATSFELLDLSISLSYWHSAQGNKVCTKDHLRILIC